MTAWDDTPSDTNPTPLPTDGRSSPVINLEAVRYRIRLRYGWQRAFVLPAKREPGNVA